MMRLTAAKHKVVTQMGNQAHAGEPIRRAVELVRAGIIGDVTEAHVMTKRPIWPQGMDKFPPKAEIPKHLEWDLWLGPAPKRDFADGIRPWESRQDNISSGATFETASDYTYSAASNGTNGVVMAHQRPL